MIEHLSLHQNKMLDKIYYQITQVKKENRLNLFIKIICKTYFTHLLTACK